jgi:hypothetical protein
MKEALKRLQHCVPKGTTPGAAGSKRYVYIHMCAKACAYNHRQDILEV